MPKSSYKQQYQPKNNYNSQPQQNEPNYAKQYNQKLQSESMPMANISVYPPPKPQRQTLATTLSPYSPLFIFAIIFLCLLITFATNSGPYSS